MSVRMLHLLFFVLISPLSWSVPYVVAPGDRYELDGTQSQILIRVYRGGLFSSLGHNHLLSVQGLSGTIVGDDSGNVTAELKFPVADILVDDADLRLQAGADFASEPSTGDITGTRKNMLGNKLLHAGQYPEINIHLVTVLCSADDCTAEVVIGVREAEKRYSVPLQISQSEGTLYVGGSLELYQTDFNIKPFSVLGGALKVADRLDVTFKLVALRI